MKTLTVKMPAFLASALVNGDVSALSTEPERCSSGEPNARKKSGLEWLAIAETYIAPGWVVSTEGEPYFSWTCGLPGWGYFGADMLDYVVMYRDEDVP